MSYERKAMSAEPHSAAAILGKRWEDLIDAAASATEEDSRDLTPVSSTFGPYYGYSASMLQGSNPLQLEQIFFTLPLFRHHSPFRDEQEDKESSSVSMSSVCNSLPSDTE